MTRVMIVGGYGAVGREAAAALVRMLPEAHIALAGRNPATAPRIAGTTVVRADAGDPVDIARLLDGTDVVLMCAELDNVPLARACLARGVHYLDITASTPLLDRLGELDAVARDTDSTCLLSVGLAPGVTNLLAAHCVTRSGAEEVRIGILGGGGERHGRQALQWILDGLGELPGAWEMDFPAPHGRRTVYQMPFSDQDTLPATIGVSRAATGLCVDSRLLTALFPAGRWPVVGRLLRRPASRAALLATLARVHLGGDAFALAVRAGDATATFSGHRQSRATGLAAATLIRRLPGMPTGVRHIEQVVQPVDFLTELADHGFSLKI
ncbi:saccharopine dehydrogenase NADP-binding domain-containing protein [Plantactinospora sp. GCM10030261]|uniref:saccharopine dehydrogenase NADP-binding domain-containing protein n=1 Tax=Plantactinospora sp. GCM10030261 TaxID=3273420 RepID=UPI003608CF28